VEAFVRLLVITVVSAALLVVATAASGAPAKDNFQLKGEVYPNSLYKIEMENKAGRKLATVRAGTYRIKIEDKATIHNFRLRGPGVNRATSVPGRAETIWTVRLRKGTYRFLCDPHPQMRGSFRVT
jgi:plastocyanin